MLKINTAYANYCSCLHILQADDEMDVESGESESEDEDSDEEEEEEEVQRMTNRPPMPTQVRKQGGVFYICSTHFIFDSPILFFIHLFYICLFSYIAPKMYMFCQFYIWSGRLAQ